MPLETLLASNPIPHPTPKAVFSNKVDSGAHKKKDMRAPIIRLFMADPSNNTIGDLKQQQQPKHTKDFNEPGKKLSDPDVVVVTPSLSMFKKHTTSKENKDDGKSVAQPKSTKESRFPFSSIVVKKSNKASHKNTPAPAPTSSNGQTTLVFGPDESDGGKKKKRRWTTKPKATFVTTKLIEQPPVEPVKGQMGRSTSDVLDLLVVEAQLANPFPRAARSLWKMSEGRKYHDVPGLCYPMPIDDDEMNRLRMQHHLLRMVQQGNYLAPIKDSLATGKVLDVGCGPGTWVLEMAAEFPSTHIVGVDVAETYFPPKETRPPNTAFHYVNVHHGLPFQDGTFDFCHQRQMSLAVREDRWPEIVSALLRVTKPGGSVQLLEQSMEFFNAGPLTYKFNKRCNHSFRARGIDPFVAERLGGLLLDAGFVNVQTSVVSVPCGDWGGKMGGRLKKDTLLTYENAKGILMPALGMTGDEFQEMLAAMDDEFEKRNTYMQFHVAYGQRPVEDWIDVWPVHPPSLIESATSASGAASGGASASISGSITLTTR